MSAIFIDGQLAHYEVIGRGKPVLFLHGWIGSWRYWVSTMQSISTTNRTYAVDFWGFGDSTKNNQYTVGDQVNFLQAFLEKIGLSHVSIIGHGLGAVVGYELAYQYPEIVDKILAISLPLSSSQINYRFLLAEPLNLVERLLGRGEEIKAVRMDELKNDSASIITSLSELESQHNFKDPGLFKKISLLVYGQNDPIVRAPGLDILQSFPSSTHSIIFENSGHFPMIDESSKFSRLLSEFLELGDEDSPRNLEIKEKWQRRVR